ncbi:cytosolic non-specific dipeptidase-like [Clytia hemisphaerica]|uniref:cytosolic non-specific dipeptidase-like n=1 Tax=Clytia hemisphaerica TaxID=252671 RepID=UPI0034D4681E
MSSKSDNLQAFYDHLMKDENRATYIQRLSDYCAYQSLSGDSAYFPICADMVNKCAEDLKTILGIAPEDVKVHTNPDGDDLPPILTAHMGNDPSKTTLLVYGHLDVQPAPDPENWVHQDDPFKLTKVPATRGTFETNKYYARGSTDDKGPVLGWINAIEAYQALNMALPVNVKFCIECMEESGGFGLEKIFENEAEFFSDVDYVCISDNYWLGQNKPCVTYGLRGLSYYNVTITGADRDLHSGVYGGTVREALMDLIKIFSKLTDDTGHITIPGVNDDVILMTDEELATYGPIEFDPEEFRKEIGTNELAHPDKVGTLTHRWRYPALSVHGFYGAAYGIADVTSIPKSVMGKFSIRLVPNQDAADIDAKVEAYIRKLHQQSGSKNDIDVKATVSVKAWLSDNTDDNYAAGMTAQERVYGMKPDLTREGGSIPPILTLQDATNSSVMMLPIGQADDGAHSQNEKMSERNYINGAKVLGAYLDELGKVVKKQAKK